MKQSKDLNAAIGQLRSLAARGDIKPQQKQLVEQAIERLRQFRRNSHPDKADMVRCVRDVAEKLFEAFMV